MDCAVLHHSLLTKSNVSLYVTFTYVCTIKFKIQILPVVLSLVQSVIFVEGYPHLCLIPQGLLRSAPALLLLGLVVEMEPSHSRFISKSFTPERHSFAFVYQAI